MNTNEYLGKSARNDLGRRRKRYGQSRLATGLFIWSLMLGSVSVGRSAESISAPTIISHPQSQTNVTGTTVTFTVSAGSSYPLRYDWQYNGASLSGATNATLTLSNLVPGNAGSYRVRVSNQVGTTVSSTAILSVIPLLITAQPKSQTAMCGSNARFAVAVSGASPLSYQWHFNDTVLPSAPASSNLTLTGLQPGNEGRYRVIITNSYGAITSAVATLTLAPSNTIAIESFNYPVGPLKELNGGIGLDGAYSRYNTDTVASGSLSYVDTNGARLLTASNRFLSAGSGIDAMRSLNTNGQFAGLLDSSGKFGADGSTLYFRFLIRRESSIVPTGNVGLGLGDDKGESFFIGNYGTLYADRTKYGIYDGTSDHTSTVPIDNQTHLIIVRIDFAAGRETVRFYADPILAAEPATASIPPFSVPDFRIAWFKFSCTSSSYSLDEICFATSWEAAAPITPVTRPTILANSVTRSNGETRFNVSGEAGRVVNVQASTNLIGTEWTTIGTVTNVSGTNLFKDTTPGASRRFYRLQQL